MIVEVRRGQWGGDGVKGRLHCEEEQRGVKWGEEEFVMDSEVRAETPTTERPSHKAQST